MTDLALIIQHIETRLAEVKQAYAAEEAATGYLSYERFREREAAYRRIVSDLQETHGAKVSTGEPMRLVLAGIRTSCTSGPHGLLTHWLDRARRAIAAGEAAAS